MKNNRNETRQEEEASRLEKRREFLRILSGGAVLAGVGSLVGCGDSLPRLRKGRAALPCPAVVRLEPPQRPSSSSSARRQLSGSAIEPSSSSPAVTVQLLELLVGFVGPGNRDETGWRAAAVRSCEFHPSARQQSVIVRYTSAPETAAIAAALGIHGISAPPVLEHEVAMPVRSWVPSDGVVSPLFGSFPSDLLTGIYSVYDRIENRQPERGQRGASSSRRKKATSKFCCRPA
jgi:hypothetical protein